MLDWIFESTANWISSVVPQLMDAVSGIFLESLGTDMTVMEEYFPFVSTAFTVMQYTAWALLFLIVVWQLFRNFGGPLTEAEPPWQLLVRGALFAFLIGYAKPIFGIALDIARAPYTALMDYTASPENFTFVGVETLLNNALVDLIAVLSVVGVILITVMVIALGWNYFKLLLEAVERYVLVGVLCYTSPLAYSMGASKSTQRVFQSWCRMVGSQLLLLLLDVWFLRAFSSSVGICMSNGGALSNGQGNIFLWLFCALALLKTAQKCDSYMAAMGLSVAQTGSSMGMEMLMAARMLTGATKGASQTVGNTFGGAGRAASAAGGPSAAGGSFFAGIASRFKPNSFVRDAVVSGGSRMGAGGSVGLVGRMFGGMAARNGATLNAESVGSVANRPANVSGTIAGDIADRSLSNFMPHLAIGGHDTKGPGDTHIGASGEAPQPSLNLDGVPGGVNPSQQPVPDTDSFAAGQAPGFTPLDGLPYGEGVSERGGTVPPQSDADHTEPVVQAQPGDFQFSDTQITGGHISTLATGPDGQQAKVDLYSAAQYEQPDCPHTVVSAADESQWYQVASGDAMGAFYTTPAFTGSASETGEVSEAFPTAPEGTLMRQVDEGTMEVNFADGSGALWYNSAYYQEPDAPHETVRDANGLSWYAMTPHASAPQFEPGSEAVDYNQAAFNQFMPGYEKTVTSFDGSRAADGVLEVRHEDGSGTAFYDRTRYQAPRGDYHVVEDSRGGQWYAVPGTPAVDHRPVYENGKPVYDGDTLRTVNVETVRYKTTPTQFTGPKLRPKGERKPPRRKS